MRKVLRVFEQAVVAALVVLMAVLISVLIFQLAWSIARDVASAPLGLLQSGGLLELFGSFLLVLIAVELLETIKAYLDEHVIHAELVLEVALIAIARKIIVLDVKVLPASTVLAVSVLALALAVAYWLQRHLGRGSITAEDPPGCCRER